MEEISERRKRKPAAVDPDNAEAVRLEQVQARKKQRLANSTAKSAKTANGSKSVKENLPRASVETIEDEEVTKSAQRAKPRNPRHVIESSDDDDDDITILEKPTQTGASKPQESESESSENDQVPEEPEESDTAELSKMI